MGPCSSETQRRKKPWCSLPWLGFNNGLQGTSRVSRIQLLLFKDGLKIASISLDVSDSRLLFPLKMETLSVE